MRILDHKGGSNVVCFEYDFSTYVQNVETQHNQSKNGIKNSWIWCISTTCVRKPPEIILRHQPTLSSSLRTLHFTRFTLFTNMLLIYFFQLTNVSCLLLNRNLNCFKMRRRRILHAYIFCLWNMSKDPGAFYLEFANNSFRRRNWRMLTSFKTTEIRERKRFSMVYFSIYLGSMFSEALFWIYERFNNYLLEACRSLGNVSV